MKPLISTKRIYTPIEASDGTRVLVDRIWPRGVSKTAAQIDLWAKDLAPSNELRKWYQHDHQKWQSFRKKYWSELQALPPQAFDQLRTCLNSKRVTFVYSSREEDLNNARALQEYCETFLIGSSNSRRKY